jgi:hypothetical protein
MILSIIALSIECPYVINMSSMQCCFKMKYVILRIADKVLIYSIKVLLIRFQCYKTWYCANCNFSAKQE